MHTLSNDSVYKSQDPAQSGNPASRTVARRIEEQPNFYSILERLLLRLATPILALNL
jgi:hypothetical protein